MIQTSMILKERYRILQELGSGAFGHTFVAEDLDVPSRRCCVLKLLKPIADQKQYQLIQERFTREAALLEKLSEGANGQIPKLYAYFAESDLFYLVQEWIDGKTLSQALLEKSRLGEELVRDMLTGMLGVIDYIHSQGIIHRDIKPDNIMIRHRNKQPVLIDFGIVKEVMSGESVMNPASSIVAGTPAYMPIEQAAGKPVYSSDLYSLGMTAIALLTGRSPQTLTDPLSGEINWREHAPNVSPALAAVLDKATEVNYRERFKTAKEMRDALEWTGPTCVGAPTLADQATVAFVNQGVPTPPNGNPRLDTGYLSTVVPNAPATIPVLPPAPEPAPAASSSANNELLEMAFWESMKGSTNPKSFEAYLNRYPTGLFADLARIKLEELAEAAQVKRQAKQTFEFDTVMLDTAGSIIDFRTSRAEMLIEELGNEVTLEMVSVPGGIFQMGSTETATEQPVRQVRVASFFMGKYPITQQQWHVVAGWPAVNRELKADPSFFKGPYHPVEQVSWEEAAEFCARLSHQTGRTYRLPNEAEWEYAARAGNTTPFGFGQTVTPDIVNYDGNFPYGKMTKGRYTAQTIPVGSLGAANGYGIFDMHGNVLEWCHDHWHPNYKGAPGNAIAWETPGETKRVLRGGSWMSSALQCRSTARDFKPAETRNRYNGFRVVLVEDSKADFNRTTGKFAQASAGKVPAVTVKPPAITNGPVLHTQELKKTMTAHLGDGVKMEFALIPAGSFRMGSNDYENERPVHEIEIGYPYHMGIYPVTQNQWRVVMGVNPSNFKNLNNPVENITWDMAQEFCEKLTAKRDGFLYRLPTESEWEYAARAGSEGKYCFGDGKNLLKEYAWFDENSQQMAQPVGMKRPNAWGLYDVHGNVYEWCQDWYHDDYNGAPTDGTAWEDGREHQFRVLRGGSWLYYASYCRASFRYRAEPNHKKSNYGFRVVAVRR
ncbi:MAG: SUMF1/EgtB/PvdO family nonheme iron enzyme [Blastocatellia bacterium]|nr:SUMF1/EgtB/PvdO family nonheme iron enzyme [Blastocatellia bacterium]